MQIENKDNEIALYEKEIALTKKEKENLQNAPYVFPGKDAALIKSTKARRKRKREKEQAERQKLQEEKQKEEQEQNVEDIPVLRQLQAISRPIQSKNHKTVTVTHNQFKLIQGDPSLWSDIADPKEFIEVSDIYDYDE